MQIISWQSLAAAIGDADAAIAQGLDIALEGFGRPFAPHICAELLVDVLPDCLAGIDFAIAQEIGHGRATGSDLILQHVADHGGQAQAEELVNIEGVSRLLPYLGGVFGGHGDSLAQTGIEILVCFVTLLNCHKDSVL